MTSIRDEEIMSLKVGDVIYECEMGMNIEARITEAPAEIESEITGKKQWRWKAVNTQNEDEINYLLTEGLSHYGPYLYRQPMYCRVKNGEMSFPLVGAPSSSSIQEKSDD